MENNKNIKFIFITFAYWIFMLIFFFWLLFEIWNGGYNLTKWFGIDLVNLSKSSFRAFAYTMIGGGIGNILYNTFKVTLYYIKGNYDPHWIFKHFTAPIEGAALAIVIFSIFKGGISALGMGGSDTNPNVSSYFFAFGLGALVGFGKWNVVKWLIELARTIFKSGDDIDKAANVQSGQIPEEQNQQKGQ